MNELKHFLATTAGRVVVTIVTAVLIFGLILLAAEIEFMPLVFLVFAVCTYFGWKALNFITPNIFLIMPVVGWIIYWLIKGVISFFVGCFVAPFQIGAMVSKAVRDSAKK